MSEDKLELDDVLQALSPIEVKTSKAVKRIYIKRNGLEVSQQRFESLYSLGVKADKLSSSLFFSSFFDRLIG